MRLAAAFLAFLIVVVPVVEANEFERLDRNLRRERDRAEDELRRARERAEAEAIRLREQAEAEAIRARDRIEAQVNRTDEDLEEIARDVEDIGKSALRGGVAVAAGIVKASIVPYNFQEEAVRAILGKQDAKEAWDRFEDRSKGAVQLVTGGTVSVARSAVAVSEMQASGLINLGGGVGGDLGEDLANAYVAPSRYLGALGLTSAQYADAVANGQDPTMLLAAPLAVALNQAYAAHNEGARAIPESIQQALAAHYGRDYLSSIRYAIGDISTISLPDGIGGINRLFGNDVAVTVNDIIIFPAEPNGASLFWWAHEIEHTRQYVALGGIENFAWAYLKHYRRLEREADAGAMEAIRSVQSEAADAQQAHEPTPSPLRVLITKLETRAGWESIACAPESSDQDLATRESIEVGLKFLDREDEAPCAVALLESNDSFLVRALLHFDSIDGSSCLNAYERSVERLQARRWSCAYSSRDADN